MAKVVVIGGGYGGITVAGGLDEVSDVVLVEQKDQFVHHAAALRAAVDPVWSRTIFMPYTRLLERGQVVQGTCMGIRDNKVFVAGHEPIEADYIVIATGSSYPYPAKHITSNSEAAKARLDMTRRALSQAERVLLVGAGTVGVEFAGEITAAFPHLKVIMVDKEPQILGTAGYVDELRAQVAAKLQERGVELVLGAPLAYNPPVDVGILNRFRVATTAGVQIEADMWFNCHGMLTASGYLQPTFDDALRPNGQLRVDEYMRVIGHPGVYAVGDVTDVPESKRADAARAHARVVIANITDQIAGKPLTTTYAPGKEWVILPLGPEGGVSQLIDPDGNVRVVGDEATADIKGGDLMVNLVRAQLNLP